MNTKTDAAPRTEPTFPALPVAKTYKSQRSAKIALGKADRAVAHALHNRCTDAMHEARPFGCTLHTQCMEYIDAAFVALRAVAAAAEAQGFSVRSSMI